MTDPRQMVQIDVREPGVLTIHSWLPIDVAQGIWPAIAQAWLKSDGALARSAATVAPSQAREIKLIGSLGPEMEPIPVALAKYAKPRRFGIVRGGLRFGPGARSRRRLALARTLRRLSGKAQ